MPMSLLRRSFRAPSLQSPPAVWAAFERVSSFKSWLLVLQSAVIFALLLLLFRALSREPDVVFVQQDGEAAFVGNGVEAAGLHEFLRAQKGAPTNAEAAHFVKEFLDASVALNASTVRSRWADALSMMSEAARARAEAEATASKLVEGFEASGQRTELRFQSLELLRRTPDFIELRAGLQRTRSRLLDGASPTTDILEVHVRLHLCGRTEAAPSGLEVAEWRLRRVEGEVAQATGSEGTPTP